MEKAIGVGWLGVEVGAINFEDHKLGELSYG